MGSNGPKYDQEADYNKKTMAELEEIKKEFEDSVVKYPHIKFINEHLQYVKMKIAERIGK